MERQQMGDTETVDPVEVFTPGYINMVHPGASGLRPITVYFK